MLFKLMIIESEKKTDMPGAGIKAFSRKHIFCMFSISATCSRDGCWKIALLEVSTHTLD